MRRIARRELAFVGLGISSRRLYVIVLMLWATTAYGANPVPQIANPLVPVTVAPGGQGFTLTVNGTGFVAGSVVNWNGSPRSTTYINNHQLTATIASADVATSTTASVTVVNPGGSPSLPALFSVRNPATTYYFGSTGFAPYLYFAHAEFLAGDFNGDGIPDIADNSGTQLEVALGIGDGTFQPVVDYGLPSTRQAYGIALGDFDNNGFYDVAIGGTDAPGFDLFLGNGDGTFQPALLDSNAPGYQLAAGDFNGDGNLDLAYTSNGAVAIVLGDGHGGFGPPTQFPVLSQQVNAVAVADLNGDGLLDLVAGNADSGGGSGSVISVLFGRGDGTFSPHVDYALGRYPTHMAVADFNGDGHPDLAVVDSGAYDTFYLLLNKGDGTFLPPVTYNGSLASTQFTSLGAADLDGDGKLDLIASEEFSCTACIEVFSGNGDGTFRPGVLFTIELLSGGTTAGTLTFADFNRDGKLDIFTQSGSGPYLMLQADAPELTFDARLTFGSQAIGTQSAPLYETVSPPSTTPVNIGAISVTGDFQIAGCQDTVVTYKCLIQVNFTPTATGNRTGVITVNSDGGPQYISLSGTGTASTLSVSVSPSSLTFATQLLKTASPYQNVTISNTGNADVTFNSISLTGNNPAEFVISNLCGSTLAAGASCIVQVGFLPNQRGARTASLSISDNATGSPQTVPLTGTGTALSLSPPSLNFGDVSVGSSSSQLLMISNVGGMTMFLQPLFVTGPASQDYSFGSCGNSLSSRGVCEVTVTFTPSTPGTRNAYLKFGNTGMGKPAMTTVPLTGSGK